MLLEPSTVNFAGVRIRPHARCRPVGLPVTVQVVKTGITPQRTLSDGFREAKTELFWTVVPAWVPGPKPPGKNAMPLDSPEPSGREWTVTQRTWRRQGQRRRDPEALTMLAPPPGDERERSALG